MWIDGRQAIIVGREGEGDETVEVVTREPAETDEAFEARAVGEVADEERITVSGRADARTAFERAYVAVTHRPDRLVDVEPSRPARRPRRTA